MILSESEIEPISRELPRDEKGLLTAQGPDGWEGAAAARG